MLQPSYVIHSDGRTFVAVEDEDGHLIVAVETNDTQPDNLVGQAQDAYTDFLLNLADGELTEFVSTCLMFGEAQRIAAFFEVNV